MQTFNEFVDKQTRKAQKHLSLMKKMFETNSMKVKDNLEGYGEEEPYIYVYNKDNDLSFEGVRIYEIGGKIVYRVQKEFDTHPYGRAYELDIVEMYDDLMNDKKKEEEIGKEIVKSVVNEIKGFFDRSAKFEKQQPMISASPLDKAYMRSTGTDYSNKVLSR